MRVRLAFSVAAHLEPKILLVDKVLPLWPCFVVIAAIAAPGMGMASNAFKQSLK